MIGTVRKTMQKQKAGALAVLLLLCLLTDMIVQSLINKSSAEDGLPAGG